MDFILKPMPELPEVETVRRTIERALAGHLLADAEVVEDSIVYQKVPAEIVREAVVGRKVEAVGRKGKYWWLELDGDTWLYGHLGMAGWVRELGQPTIRLKEHGEAPMEDENGRPRFLKLMLTSDQGRRIAMTDGRRLARVWLGGPASGETKILELGPDALRDLPASEVLAKYLSTRKAPIKATLMDQTWISGLGNWLADEVLFHAKIAPARTGASLSLEEVSALRAHILKILETAVDAGADEHKYPADWLFHVRWGGGRGGEFHLGKRLVRETIGGRTTAWIPEVQK